VGRHRPHLSTFTRGLKGVDDRRVINSMLRCFRIGSFMAWFRRVLILVPPSANGFPAGGKADLWGFILDAISKSYDGDIVMKDGSCIRV
jgi:hypothetical protein